MKTKLEMATDIVTSQIKRFPSSSIQDLTGTIASVFRTLLELNEESTTLPRAILPSPEASIQRHKIICLECGGDFKLLGNRHLARHGLTHNAYKEKHGLRRGQPLSCQTLTQRRRRLATSQGAGRALAKWREARQSAAVEAHRAAR